MNSQHEDFVAFAEASMRDLRRTAYLLCGDWQRAEDAMQNALIKVFLRWKKLDKENSLWGYARRAVVTAVIDESRKGFRSREHGMPELPEHGHSDETGTVDDRLLLTQALDALPRRQRAVVILRYADDLDVAQTAFVLTCPPGTVTSYATRALAFLRTYLTDRGYVRGPGSGVVRGDES